MLALLTQATGPGRPGTIVLPVLRERCGAAEGVGKTPGAEASWAVCRREGEYGSIAYAGEAFRLKGVNGLHHVAHLLRHPGREFPRTGPGGRRAGGRGGSARRSPAQVDDLHRGRLSDTGPVLDQKAKRAYRARLRELEEELNEASSLADPSRAEKARQMQFLADQLAAAVGLGGRNRTPGSPAERARPAQLVAAARRVQRRRARRRSGR